MPLKQYPEGKIFYKVTEGQTPSNDKLPAILFIHAAITDHTLWEKQVAFLSQRGFTCIQFDMLGFGASEVGETYLNSSPRAELDYVKHIVDLITEVSKPPNKVIVAGVSMGGMFALRTACLHPELVAGVVAVASGVPGYDAGWDPREMELDGEIETAITEGDVEKAAKLQVHYWGDGPLQAQGRCDDSVSKQMYQWSLEIAKRQHSETGGFAFPTIKRAPVTADELKKLDMPFAVAIGQFDESSTNTSQKHLAETVKDSELRSFEAAHLVNLECPEEFNEWVYNWLSQKKTSL